MDGTAATQMVIQLPMSISTDDLSVRHQLEDLLDQALRVADVGMVDGGDIGSGTMNVFALVTTERWVDALAATVTVLREFGVDDVLLPEGPAGHRDRVAAKASASPRSLPACTDFPLRTPRESPL